MSDRPPDFWTRWKEARLARVLLVYLGSCFAVLQAVDVFVDQLGLPAWVFPGSLVLLVLGLPVIVATALVQSASASAPTESPYAAGTAGAPRLQETGGPPASEPASVEAGGPATASAVEPSEDRSGERGTDAPAGPASSRSGGALGIARRWLTWRRAIVGGTAAFALWGVVVTAYMAMRTLGIGPVGSLVAAGVLEERDYIVLAEFENHTPDSVLSAVVTEAFRVDLAQSPVVTLVQSDQIGNALRRMGRTPSDRLDAELAREVAIREGFKAVIEGEIGTVGGSFVLSARLISAGTGEMLAAARQTASDSTRIVEAIDGLSSDLRVRIGESLKRVRANPPLDQVTTPSLEALRKYSQGVRALEESDGARGIRLLEEAVALDTAFAMAWRKLGIALSNRGQDRTREVEALTRAYRFRERLTDRERYLTEGSYHQNVTREYDRAITAYRTLLDIYPDDGWSLNNLALAYAQIGDYERAAETASRAIERDSSVTSPYNNLIGALVNLGRLDEAEETLRRFANHHPEQPGAFLQAAGLASLRGDYAIAEERVHALRARYGPDPFVRLLTADLLAALARVQGRLAEAERHVRDAMSIALERERYGQYHTFTYALALQRLLFGGSTDRAREPVAVAEARYPFDSVPPLDRPYDLSIAFHALDGRPAEARALLDELRSIPRPDERSYLGVTGMVALSEGRYEDAIERFREQSEDPLDCRVCALATLALAYDGLGQPDSTLAVLERYLDTPAPGRLGWDSFFLGSAYERLIALYGERGDHEKARQYYRKLSDLWADADPELRPRLEAAGRALTTLAGDR